MATQICSVFKNVKSAIDSVRTNLELVGTHRLIESSREAILSFDDEFIIHFNLNGRGKSLKFNKKRYCYSRIYIGRNKVIFTYCEGRKKNGMPIKEKYNDSLTIDQFINDYMPHVKHVSEVVEIMPTRYKKNTKKMIAGLEAIGFNLESKSEKDQTYLFK